LRPGNFLAQDARQPARVDAGDRDNLAALEELRQRLVRAPVARDGRQIADHEAGGIHLRGLQILWRRAGVADVRHGERDDLSRVRRVSENFLIAREGGVENDFACGVALGSDRLAAEDRSVGQREHRRYAHVITSP